MGTTLTSEEIKAAIDVLQDDYFSHYYGWVEHETKFPYEVGFFKELYLLKENKENIITT